MSHGSIPPKPSPTNSVIPPPPGKKTGQEQPVKAGLDYSQVEVENKVARSDSLDSGYETESPGKALAEREITSKPKEMNSSAQLPRTFQQDQKKFWNAVKAISDALEDYVLDELEVLPPYWIVSNRYPVRQFRAYYLLEVDQVDPQNHAKLYAVMTDLERRFDQHLNSRLPGPVPPLTEAAALLGASQVFLRKDDTVAATIKQGYSLAPGLIVFSLQDAEYELNLSNKRVLEGLPIPEHLAKDDDTDE